MIIDQAVDHGPRFPALSTAATRQYQVPSANGELNVPLVGMYTRGYAG